MCSLCRVSVISGGGFHSGECAVVPGEAEDKELTCGAIPENYVHMVVPVAAVIVKLTFTLAMHSDNNVP